MQHSQTTSHKHNPGSTRWASPLVLNIEHLMDAFIQTASAYDEYLQLRLFSVIHLLRALISLANLSVLSHCFKRALFERVAVPHPVEWKPSKRKPVSGKGMYWEPAAWYRKVAGLIPLFCMLTCPRTDSEPQTAPDVLVGILHGNNHQQCMNVCVNYCKLLWTKASDKM